MSLEFNYVFFHYSIIASIRSNNKSKTDLHHQKRFIPKLIRSLYHQLIIRCLHRSRVQRSRSVEKSRVNVESSKSRIGLLYSSAVVTHLLPVMLIAQRPARALHSYALFLPLPRNHLWFGSLTIELSHVRVRYSWIPA